MSGGGRGEGKEASDEAHLGVGIELPQMTMCHIWPLMMIFERIGRRNSAIGVRHWESDHRSRGKRQSCNHNMATFKSPVWASTASPCSFTAILSSVCPPPHSPWIHTRPNRNHHTEICLQIVFAI